MNETSVFDAEAERRLNLTQHTREQIVRDMLKDGKLPADREDRAFLMQALDGMDRTTLSTVKIKSDDSNAKGKQETTRMIADILSKVPVRNLTPRLEAPVIDVEAVPVPDDIVHGEMEIGVRSFKYAEMTGSDS